MEFNKKFFKKNIKTIFIMVIAIIFFALINIILSKNSDNALIEKDLPIKGEGRYEGLVITEIKLVKERKPLKRTLPLTQNLQMK